MSIITSADVAGNDPITAAGHNNMRADIVIAGGDYAITTGSANAYALAVADAFTLTAGSVVKFKANFANTGAATLNVTPSGGAATGDISIKKLHDQALEANDIENGSIVILIYDGTSWQMLTPPATQMSSAASAALTGGGVGDDYHLHRGLLGTGGGDWYSIPASGNSTDWNAVTSGNVTGALITIDNNSTADKITLMDTSRICGYGALSGLGFESFYDYYMDSGGADVDFHIGWGPSACFTVAYNAGGGAGTNFIGFAIDGSAGHLYAKIVSNNSVTTLQDLGALALQTNVKLKVIATATEVKFYVNGSLVHTATTGLPTISSVNFIYFGIGEHEVTAYGNNHSSNMRTPVIAIKLT